MATKLPTVLYLAESFPFSLVSGYQLRVAATILALTRCSKVHLLSFHDQPLSKTQAIQKVQAFAQTLPTKERSEFLARLHWTIIVLPQINQPIGQRWREWLLAWKTQEPFLTWQYRSPEFNQQVTQLINRLHPEIIHFSHLRLAEYLKPWLKIIKTKAVPSTQPLIVYEAVNVEWLLTKSFADFLPKFGRWRWWWRREQWLTKKFEEFVVTHVDLILTLSQTDQLALQTLGAREVITLPILYPPNGQKNPPSGPQPISHNSPPKLLFVGNLNWLPNADALRWFLTQIWPTVAQANTTVELVVVGEPCSYLSLQPTVAKDRVKFLGFVKNLDPVLSQCQIGLLPFRMGGGVRLKALTAAWAGQAIVSTPLGIQGLDLRSGKNCLVGTTAQEFTNQLINLLQSPNKAKTLGLAAQQYIRRHHSKTVAQKVWDHYWATGVGSSIHSKT